MKKIVAQLLSVANKLDEAKLYSDATRITKIAQSFDITDAMDSIGQTTQCPHNNVEYLGNDGENEVARECYGVCVDCGAEMEGWEVIDGADDEGRPEYGVQEWRQASTLNKIIRAADILDEKHAYKFADEIGAIIKMAQSTETWWRVISQAHVEPEIRKDQMIPMFELDKSFTIHGSPGDYGLEPINRSEIPMLGQHWVREYQIPEVVYADPSRTVFIYKPGSSKDTNEMSNEYMPSENAIGEYNPDQWNW